MKQCPQCGFLYLDSDRFCDLDGTLLIVSPETVESAAENVTPQQRGPRWKAVSIAAIGGMALGVIIFLAYHRITRREEPSMRDELPSVVITQPSPPIDPEPEPSGTPTPEPSPSPTPKPSPTSRGTSAPAHLSKDPVSTASAGNAKRGVIIRLTDGGTIAAEQAWDTGEGIWYRRGGVVALLKRNQVKGIEKAP